MLFSVVNETVFIILSFILTFLPYLHFNICPKKFEALDETLHKGSLGKINTRLESTREVQNYK